MFSLIHTHCKRPGGRERACSQIKLWGKGEGREGEEEEGEEEEEGRRERRNEGGKAGRETVQIQLHHS